MIKIKIYLLYSYLKCQLFSLSLSLRDTRISWALNVADFAMSIKIYLVGDKVLDAVKLVVSPMMVLLRYLAPKLKDVVFGQGSTERWSIRQ